MSKHSPILPYRYTHIYGSLFTMKTTIEIADPLFEQAKRHAAEHDCTLREVVESGLRNLLKQSAAPRQPFRLRKGSFKGKGLAQPLDWREIRERIYEGRGE